MVKSNITRSKVNKGKKRPLLWTRKICASTPYETCSEPLSEFGGMLALIKFLGLVGFEEVFEHCYRKSARGPNLGHYRMVVGIVMLLFIGFNRIGHFSYIRFNAMLRRFLQVASLPVVSTVGLDKEKIKQYVTWQTKKNKDIK